MAMNFESKLSDKENEIATAKTDAEWSSMNIDEIHTRVFGNTGIASGLLSAQGKRPDGTTFSANSRFHALLFGINRLRSDELPHSWAKRTVPEHLCNYCATAYEDSYNGVTRLNTHGRCLKSVDTKKAFQRKGRFPAKWIVSGLRVTSSSIAALRLELQTGDVL